jgi:RNA polymerase sigma-70 factor, ECF subfamily
MSRYEQLRYQEIADQLGLSVKTVENQMGKALKIVREELKDYLPLLILFFIQTL